MDIWSLLTTLISVVVNSKPESKPTDRNFDSCCTDSSILWAKVTPLFYTVLVSAYKNQCEISLMCCTLSGQEFSSFNLDFKRKKTHTAAWQKKISSSCTLLFTHKNITIHMWELLVTVYHRRTSCAVKLGESWNVSISLCLQEKS